MNFPTLIVLCTIVSITLGDNSCMQQTTDHTDYYCHGQYYNLECSGDSSFSCENNVASCTCQTLNTGAIVGICIAIVVLIVGCILLCCRFCSCCP